MSLTLTRKREKEIKKLRKQAEKLWSVQRDVGERASLLATQAADQAKAYGNETLVPEARRVAQRGVSKGRDAVSGVTHGWNDKVLPSVATGLGSFAAYAQIAKDQRVKDAIANVQRLRLPEVKPAKKSGPSALQWVLIGVGTVAVAGAAYAAWQTLRADDDLWIPDSDESDSSN
ncbi:hypothetical protein GCM10009846_30400 [Agrococcus versicolor]|uniref:DNA helicase n=1 Tax=Agrococcus versicolor TaxID=501482 RepID=A0ABP5MTU7_9MICO